MIAVGLRTTSVILGKTRAALYRVCRSTTSCHRPLPDLLDVVHRHTLLPVIPQTKQGSSVGGGTARVNPRHAGQDEGSEDACCGVVDCRGKRRYGPAHGRAERSIPCSPAPARFEGLRRVRITPAAAGPVARGGPAPRRRLRGQPGRPGTQMVSPGSDPCRLAVTMSSVVMRGIPAHVERAGLENCGRASGSRVRIPPPPLEVEGSEVAWSLTAEPSP